MDDDEPSSHFYYSQRLRLHYADWGNRSAPPLILIHGGHDQCRSWDGIARAFRSDWHVMCPDLRGHGDSDHVNDGNYPLEAMIYDLAQFVRQNGEGPVTIIAHSLGGMVALAFAGLYPPLVDRIIVVEGLAFPPFLEERWAAMTVAERWSTWIDETFKISGRLSKRYASIEAATERMLAENSSLSPELARHLTVHGTSRNEDGSYSWKFDNYMRVVHPRTLGKDGLAQLWSRIACETLLVYGAQSWALPASQSDELKHFINAREVLIDGAGHWVYHDQPDRFIQEARHFLARSHA